MSETTPRPRPLPPPSGAGNERILIVGAGLVGSLLSIFLARRGYQVEVYDRAPDLRQIAADGIRSSINLSLSEKGLRALDQVGLGEAARKLSVESFGRLIHGVDGDLRYQPYGSNGERTYSILRNRLNQILLDHAEDELGVLFHFNQQCVDLDLDDVAATFRDLKGGPPQRIAADRIFGADGIFSAVRSRLQRTRRFNYSQRYLDHGYKEVSIPASAGAKWMERREAVHLWPRGGFMLLGLPNPDGSYVCAIHMPIEGEISFAAMRSELDVQDLFAASFPDVVDCCPTLARDFFRHTMNYLVSVRCYPWRYGDRIGLIGDSAHAVFPFFAQGVNSGFEDCLELDRCLEVYGDDWEAALETYQQVRKPNADAISDLSYEHFLRLRDQVGKPSFLVRKRIERILSEMFAGSFVPMYSLVTFTSTPYREAQELGEAQAVVVGQVEERLEKPEPSDSEIEAAIYRVWETSPSMFGHVAVSGVR